jgi:hypothetical protein
LGSQASTCRTSIAAKSSAPSRRPARRHARGWRISVSRLRRRPALHSCPRGMATRRLRRGCCFGACSIRPPG